MMMYSGAVQGTERTTFPILRGRLGVLGGFWGGGGGLAGWAASRLSDSRVE